MSKLSTIPLTEHKVKLDWSQNAMRVIYKRQLT